MKRIILPMLIGVSALAIFALGSRRAVADDETDDTQIRIQAPLDAVDCSAMTTSILGLSIDIQGASIVGGECGDSDDGDDEEDGEADSSLHGDDEGTCPLTCADLTTGRSVTATLSSDATPLTATELRQDDEGDDENEGEDNDEGGDDQEVEIEAPVQAVDATAQTIQVLGLTVDVSQADFEGADDEDDHDCGQPVDSSDLMVGQFVDVELASSQPPLIATEVRIENFSNQVEVEVDGPNGLPLDAADLRVLVSDRVSVRGRSHRVERVLYFQMSVSRGTFTLSGLPTGRAKIMVTGLAGGVMSKGKSRVEVSPNQTLHTRVHLRRSRS